MDEGDERTEKVIKLLNDAYNEKQTLRTTEHPLIRKAVRAAFAVILKFSGRLSDWLAAVENPNASLLPLWTSASRIRFLFDKKANKGDAESAYAKLLARIKDKASLLLKFKVPTKIQEKEEGKQGVVTRKANREEKAQLITPSSKLNNWRAMQLALIEKSEPLSFSSAIIRLLESKVTAAQVATYLESHCLHAVTACNALLVLKYFLNGVSSSAALLDMWSWIESMFCKNSLEHWHYSDFSSACGDKFGLNIQTAFFGVIKKLLKGLKTVKVFKNLPCLLNLLKFNYSAKDHEALNESQLLVRLHEVNQSLGTIAGLIERANHEENEEILPLWEEAKEDPSAKLSKALFKTFDFIVRKVANNIYEDKKLIDNEVSKKLLGDITGIISKELNKAADSYEAAEGINPSLAKDCTDENKRKEAKSKLREEQRKCGAYSHKLCSRLLSQFHCLCATAPAATDFTPLFRLLKVGSLQHQFLALQTLPLAVSCCYEDLVSAASAVKSIKYTNNPLLDWLIAFTMERRRAMWTSEVEVSQGTYSMTKHAIAVIRTLARQSKEISSALAAAVRGVVFGKAVERRDKEFVETLLSIVGGEHCSVYKGAKTADGFTVACFNDSGKANAGGWDFAAGKHNEAVLHEAGNGLTRNEPSMVKVKASRVLPVGEEVDLAVLFHGVDSGQVAEVLKRAVTSPLPEDPLLASIQVKVVKVMINYLSQCKELAKDLLDKEFTESLLKISLGRTKVISSKSLATHELIIEEMRKTACQSGKKCLSSVAPLLIVEVVDDVLVLAFQRAKKSVRAIAHKKIEEVSDLALKALKYTKEQAIARPHNDALFVASKDKQHIPELSKYTKLLITDTPLEEFNDLQVPLLQITAEDMNNLEVYMEQLTQTNDYLKHSSFNKIISKYLNIERKGNSEVVNFALAIEELLLKNKEESKPAKEVEEVLETLAKDETLMKEMCKAKLDEIVVEERESLGRLFGMKCAGLYASAKDVNRYFDVLSDIKLLAARRLLLKLLAVEPKISIDLNYLFLMILEGEYLHYGFGYKKLLREVCKVAEFAAKNSEDFMIQFDKVLQEKLSSSLAEYSKGEQNSNDVYKPIKLFDATAETTFILSIHRLLRTLLKSHPLILLKHKNIKAVVEALAALVVTSKSHADKYRCCLVIRQILASACKHHKDLSLTEYNSILCNKGIEAISTFARKATGGTNFVGRILSEINVKAYYSYKAAMEQYGEEAVASCALGNLKHFLGVEIMKAFPNMAPLLNYVWLRTCLKSSKSVNAVRLEGFNPFYHTKYCVLAEVSNAESVDISLKTNLLTEFKLSSDRNCSTVLGTITEKEATVPLNSNRVYISFQTGSSSLYGFGSNEGGRLGFGTQESVTFPQQVKGVGYGKVERVCSAGSHTIILKESGQMIVAGKGNGMLGAEANTFAQYTKEGMSKVVDSGKEITLYYNSNDRKVHIIGDNISGLLPGPAKQCADEISASDLGEIAQISTSSTHALLLNTNGTLHSSASKEDSSDDMIIFGNIFGDEDEEEGVKLKQFEVVKVERKVEKVLALEAVSVVLCATASGGELCSRGKSCCVLGRNATESNDFARLNYEEGTEFVDVVGREKMAAAITSKGELFTWGESSGCALGLCKEDGSPLTTANVPTKVPIPDSLKVINVSVGDNHMLVLAEDKATHKRVVLCFGDNKSNQLGIEDTSAIKSELKHFESVSPYLVVAGSNCSFVFSSDYDGAANTVPICEVHRTELKERSYVSSTRSGLKFYCHECIGALPDVTIAVRNPIKGIVEKSWPLLDSFECEEKKGTVECKRCKAKIEKVIYYSAVKEIQETLCETCYLKTPSVIAPCIYYRVANLQLFLTREFPVLSLADYYKTVDGLLAITVTPKYRLSVPKELRDAETELTLEEFLAESKVFTKEDDLGIVDLLSRSEKDYSDFSLKKDIPLEFEKKFSSSKLTKDTLTRRAKVIIKLNKIVKSMLASIDFYSRASDCDIYRHYEKVKDYILPSMKHAIVNEKCKMQGQPQVKDFHLYTELPSTLRSLGATDYTGQYTIFGQLRRLLRTNILSYNKQSLPFKPIVVCGDKNDSDTKRLFKLLSAELQSNDLPLLIPTPNNKILYGDFRDCYKVNPSANRAAHLEMYEDFGMLLGICFRFIQFPLSLEPAFWKRLMGAAAGRQDLGQSDLYCAQCLDALESDAFGGVDKLGKFTTRLSDGTEVELKENGKRLDVTFDDRKEYAELVEKARLKEDKQQMKAIIRGMSKIIPQYLIKLYSPKELEKKICGSVTFNVPKLKKIAKYKNCNVRDTHVQYFWLALEQLDKDKASACAQYLCGKSKFPTESAIFIIDVKECDDADRELPEVDRCYFKQGNYSSFKLSLPKYSTLEITKEKLLDAISSCRLIDEDINVVLAYEDI